MQGKKIFDSKIYYNINLDRMVPEDHLLKKLDSLVSFDFISDKTKSYYSHTGKPSIDSVRCYSLGIYLIYVQKES